MEIRKQSLAIRCEICHQSDQYDAHNNVCSRCSGVPIKLVSQPSRDVKTLASEAVERMPFTINEVMEAYYPDHIWINVRDRVNNPQKSNIIASIDRLQFHTLIPKQQRALMETIYMVSQKQPFEWIYEKPDMELIRNVLIDLLVVIHAHDIDWKKTISEANRIKADLIDMAASDNCKEIIKVTDRDGEVTFVNRDAKAVLLPAGTTIDKFGKIHRSKKLTLKHKIKNLLDSGKLQAISALLIAINIMIMSFQFSPIEILITNLSLIWAITSTLTYSKNKIKKLNSDNGENNGHNKN